MSGTSLDGIDIAYCTFTKKTKGWNYKIEIAETFKYDHKWVEILSDIHQKDALNLVKYHIEYGYYTGKLVNLFIQEHHINPEFIASHGHTVFHQPQNKLTFQLGDGNAIATRTNLPVICDFRTKDVLAGGQGAPLVPVGDGLLFPEYDYCLNLGGFANISYEKNKTRIAYDICPVNKALNYFAKKENRAFDYEGKLASKGKLLIPLLNKLNNISFYQKQPPKSLSREWFEKVFLSEISSAGYSNRDILRTLTEHIAVLIALSTNKTAKRKILITGGGAKNAFLIEKIKHHNQNDLIIPDEFLIDFKEAMIFAFLGVLRLRNEINCLKSVTGANKDTSCGIIFRP